jgi:hypothetical protein
MATLLSPISTLYQPARARSRYFPISRIFFKLPRLMALHPSRSPTGIFSTRTQPYTPGYSACTPFSPLTLVAWYHGTILYRGTGLAGTTVPTVLPWYRGTKYKLLRPRVRTVGTSIPQGPRMRVLLLAAAAASALELSGDTFEAEVFGSGKNSFIKFLAPW